MSNEIHVDYPSGNTLYVCVRNSSDQVWYVAGQVFEDWGTGGRANDDYDIQATDKSGSRYSVDFDANIPAGDYSVQVFFQSGGSPAAGDVIMTGQDGTWDGTNWLTGEGLNASEIWQDFNMENVSGSTYPNSPAVVLREKGALDR